MTASSDDRQRLGLTALEGWLILLAGAVSLFGTYWDDAWHTDRGRDTAWAPPHLALYGGVAVTGMVLLVWGLRSWARAGSPRAALRHRPLLLAGTGAVLALAAAPADNFWHLAYGRDAVLWSPPHVLVIFAGTAMVTGVLAGLTPAAPAALRYGLGALLLGDLLMVVMEYDADVPQFSAVWYVPVLAAAGVLAASLVRMLVPLPWPVSAAVAGYVALRLVVMAALAALGHSLPYPPVAVLGLCLVDLPWRHWAVRYLAGVAGVAVTAWLAAATGTGALPAQVMAVAALLACGLLAVAALILRGQAGRVTAAGLAMVAFAGTVGAHPSPAAAHDPGQGPAVAEATVTGSAESPGRMRLAVQLSTHCQDLTPVRMVARRAGQVRIGDLVRQDPCRMEGTVQVPAEGRWFLYAELSGTAGPAEVWVPVDSDRPGTVREHRTVYRPKAPTAPATKYVAGGLLYAVGLGVLLFAWLTARRVARARHGAAVRLSGAPR